MTDHSALISGASIAGPVLAWWLARAGFTPTIVERAPARRPGGASDRGARCRRLDRRAPPAAARAIQSALDEARNPIALDA